MSTDKKRPDYSTSKEKWLIYMFIKFISTRKAPTHTHDLLLQIINRMKTDFGSV